jgi:hypothetical protein
VQRRTFLKAAAALGVSTVGGRAVHGAVAATAPYRAFSGSSYWNQPLPPGAPIDVDSARFIADAKAHSGSFLQLTLDEFAQPFYFAGQGDPLQTVMAGGKSVTLHVPAAAAPTKSSDAELVIFDPSVNVAAGFHSAKLAAGGQLMAADLDRWHLDSNGLVGTLPQSDDGYNAGHRGSPAPLRGIRLDEVKSGIIAHKLAVSWWATGPGYYFPMAGDEGANGGIVPEGMQLRVKTSIDLSARFPVGHPSYVIAKAFQDYGLYVSDNSGSGSRCKLQRTSAWAALGINANSMARLPWDDWEFIQRGYGS